MKNFSINEFDNMGVHELRTFARSVGVKSPTSKTRQVLLDEIEQIRQGKMKPYHNGRFGRPIKNYTNTKQDCLITKVLTGIGDELQDKLEYNSIDYSKNMVAFQQNTDAQENNDIICVKGILRSTEQNEFYFLNQQKTTKKNYITVDLCDVIKYKLMVGDMIEGFAECLQNTNFAKLKNITQIDEKDAKENFFDVDMEYILPEKFVDNSGLKYGQSTLICSQDRDSAIKFIETKVEELKNPDTKFIVVGLNCSIETKLRLNKIEGVTQISAVNDFTASVQKEILIDAYNYANSLFCHRYNVVVFFLNILSNFEILDTAYKCNNGHSEEVTLMTSKAVSQCKASKNASITVFGLYYENQTKTYENELKILSTIINS